MKKIFLLLLVALFVSSCTLVPEDTVSFSQVAVSLTQHSNWTPDGSRAVVPYWRDDIDPIADRSGSETNYPQVGQNTEWTTTEVNTTDNRTIYRVRSITRYPNNDFIDYLEEVYFLKDNTPSSQTTVPKDHYVYVDSNGVENTLYRETYETRFSTGAIRQEVIVADSVVPDSYPLSVVKEAFVPFETITIDPDFYSVVTYEHGALDGDFSNVRVMGTRYYVNLGGGQERILIKESGFVVNLRLINGQVYRGRNDFVARIYITLVNGVESIQGYYEFITGSGVIRVNL